MPNGEIHFEAYKKLWPIAVLEAIAIVAISPKSYPLAIMVVLFYFTGRWNDNDLDQIGLTQAEGRAMRELGPLGVLWSMVTMYYAWTIRMISKALGIKNPQHQGALTHGWFATPIRVAILNLPLYIALYATGYFYQIPAQWRWWWLFAQVLAYYPNDLLHWHMDWQEEQRRLKALSKRTSKRRTQSKSRNQFREERPRKRR